MKKVIILNGAPGTGKDTVADLAKKVCGFHVASFKEPMFRIVAAMLGNAGFMRFMDDYNNREKKEKPQEYLGGKSPREMMIWISEEVIKPVFGNQHFGKVASESIRPVNNHVIFSDGGFADEVIRLIKDGYDVHLIRLHREGFDFSGDSRSHIRLPGLIKEGCYNESDIDVVEGNPLLTLSCILQAAEVEH